MIISGIYILLSFIFGGIPTGYLIVKAMTKTDIRKTGSGNIGATNVKRVLGMKWFVIVLILDMIKGAIPILIARLYFQSAHHLELILVLVAAFTILGNMFSPFLNFKGGKGVATSAGSLISIFPLPVAAALVIFSIVLALFNYVSLGSLMAVITLPFFVFIQQKYFSTNFSYPFFIFSIVFALVIVISHKNNIIRLIHGNENKFLSKK